MITLSSDDVVFDFETVLEVAQMQAVGVRCGGGVNAYIISPHEFERLRRLDRQVLTLAELSDNDFQAIVAASAGPALSGGGVAGDSNVFAGDSS